MHNVPIERRLVNFAAPPTNFVSPLQSGYCAAIGTPTEYPAEQVDL